jgi:aspartate-semialdehyde dehydrogenase
VSDGFVVAVVGATGAVGECLLSILAERRFPVHRLVPLASERSRGLKVPFRGEEIPVEVLESFDFAGVDIAFFSAGGAVSALHAPRAAAAGAAVIDNTSHFRLDPEVPLVVPEVNPDALASWRRKGIVANPNCSTAQLMVVLAPLHRAAGLERIQVATYQSVSGAGRSALEELGRQTAELLNFREVKPKRFPVQIAFNLIPHIDAFEPNGYTREEMKMVWESRRILSAPALRVSATCVRVPVFYGHSEAVAIETRRPLSVEEARRILAQAPGVELVDEARDGGYPTPVTHASGKDPVFVGRLRQDLSHPQGLMLWVVADNIRKGAALNAVQIAEVLVKSYW